MRQVDLIDGNPDSRVLTAEILGGSYRVHAQETATDAVRIWRRRSPQIVLLDVPLREAAALETLRMISALPNLGDLPVVAYTAQAMNGDRERLLSIGFDDYVSKPIVDDTVLKSVLARLLGAVERRPSHPVLASRRTLMSVERFRPRARRTPCILYRERSRGGDAEGSTTTM